MVNQEYLKLSMKYTATREEISEAIKNNPELYNKDRTLRFTCGECFTKYTSNTIFKKGKTLVCGKCHQIRVKSLMK
jgi:Zn finger protein HypA/HybF involved in hydrogenase expression